MRVVVVQYSFNTVQSTVAQFVAATLPLSPLIPARYWDHRWTRRLESQGPASEHNVNPFDSITTSSLAPVSNGVNTAYDLHFGASCLV